MVTIKVVKGLKYLENTNYKKDADILRKLYGIESLAEMSKYQYKYGGIVKDNIKDIHNGKF